ncbi:hypothetical protein ACFLWA_00060 [Chloroflexota bacterium]
MKDAVRVAVRRFSLASLGKFGCLLGAVAAILPSLLCGFLGLALAGLLLRWLESWQDMSISLLGSEVASIDLAQFLNLEGLLKLLTVLASASGAALFLAVLVFALLSGIVVAIMVILLGVIYNLVASATGGMVVELSNVREQDTSE